MLVIHLKPYRRMVDQARQRNPGHPLWPLLEADWAKLVSQAKELQAASELGLPYTRLDLVRAQQVIAVDQSATPAQVVDAMLSMVMLWEDQPRRFVSDDAFRAQLARRFRLLAPRMSKGSYWNPKLERVSQVVVELPPRVNLALGQQLAELFGPAGIKLMQLERSRVPPEEARRQALHAALETLQ